MWKKLNPNALQYKKISTSNNTKHFHITWPPNGALPLADPIRDFGYNNKASSFSNFPHGDPTLSKLETNMLIFNRSHSWKRRASERQSKRNLSTPISNINSTIRPLENTHTHTRQAVRVEQTSRRRQPEPSPFRQDDHDLLFNRGLYNSSPSLQFRSGGTDKLVFT